MASRIPSPSERKSGATLREHTPQSIEARVRYLEATSSTKAKKLDDVCNQVDVISIQLADILNLQGQAKSIADVHNLKTASDACRPHDVISKGHCSTQTGRKRKDIKTPRDAQGEGGQLSLALLSDLQVDRSIAKKEDPEGLLLNSRSQLIIKRQDLGEFDPEFNDSEDDGIHSPGQYLIFTDVHLFEQHIRAFLEHDNSQDDFEGQILTLLHTRLRGSALLWWINEVTETTRQQLRAAGVREILVAMRNRFSRASVASSRFKDGELYFEDIDRDMNAPSAHIGRMLRYARITGALADNNSNWHSVMLDIWYTMSPGIRQHLRAPRKKETLDTYMQYVERSKPRLYSLARSEC